MHCFVGVGNGCIQDDCLSRYQRIQVGEPRHCKAVEKAGSAVPAFQAHQGPGKKVDKAIDRDNPPTQIALARRHQVSRTTIRRMLAEDLGVGLRKKVRTHALSNKQIQQRLDRGPRLLKILRGGRWKYIISLDEAWLSLNDTGGIRDVYYKKKGKEAPQSRTKKWKQKYAKKIMYAAGVSARGVTGIYFVPPTTKVNQKFFINKILKPIVERDIPRLYPGEEHKVILHFDSASSHTTPAVYQWLKDRKVKFIGKEDWLSNSPDMSPMDYGANGIFKKMMFATKPKDLFGLERCARRVWKEFPLATSHSIMKGWIQRVEKMLKNSGHQIENMNK